jgi:hypothetical protein
MLSVMSKSALTRSLVAAATLAAAVALSVFGSPVRAADASDIPGVPLPAPVVTGRLGGPMYDVVYRLTVEPGFVVVASLTGTLGTDFDLYLFDSTATTIMSTVGLVAKSVGSASTESMSVPSPLGGTYYLDLNGATDVEGDFRLTVQTVADRTPPAATLELADGRAATNQPTVSTTLDASDDLSGVAEMAFSTDGSTFASWVPYRRMATWTFAPGDGPRTLWAKVRNGAGLESPPTSATVTVDTVQPSVLAISPAPGSSVVDLRPPFAVTFDEPMDPASWRDLGLVVQAAGGALVQGTYEYIPARRTGTFVPSSTLNPGATYVVTIGMVKDVAGNRPAPRGSWVVTPLAPSNLELRAVPALLAQGGSSTIALSLLGAPLPANVKVQSRAGSSTEWAFVADLPVLDGRATLRVTPDRITVYRFTYEGSTGVAPAQAEVAVQVKRAVAFVRSGAVAVGQARVGRSVRITAALSPAGPRTAVVLRLYRYDTVRRAWVYAGSRGRNSDAAGRATVTWTPTSSGAYYWRAAVAATADHAANVSSVYRWSVTR